VYIKNEKRAREGMGEKHGKEGKMKAVRVTTKK
jgi:hypothetical protein